MHWFREGNRQRSRILYVFRTPGGVRVGRAPLEPDVLRQIESQHPDIDFEWDIIRENQQVIDPLVEPRRRRPKREDAEPAAAPPVSAPPPEPVASVAPPPALAPPAPTESRLLSIPSTLQGTTADEQIEFLSEWYPIVRDRIPGRTSDPARREALLALAERLNPATWTDADQITAGLQDAAQALERLAHVFARRRRRPRRRPGSAPPSSSPPPASES
jgi:hypothetical protein